MVTTTATKPTSTTTCPDCGLAMQPIKLIDHSIEPDRELEYAAADARPSVLLGRCHTAGVVEASLCPGCGRILLYAAPYKESHSS